MKKAMALSLGIMLLGIGCTSTAPAENETTALNNTQQTAGAREGAFIRLTSPQEDQVVKSPFLIGGEAQLPDNKAYIRVKNTRGETLISETAVIKAANGEPGPFSVLIRFAFQSTDSGMVDVYGVDPETNAEVELQTIPVGFDISGSGSADGSL